MLQKEKKERGEKEGGEGEMKGGKRHGRNKP